jgi:hypothetical protein
MAFCLANMASFKMHKYRSDHPSGAQAYIIEHNYVKVLFPPNKNGEQFVYKYSYTKPGKKHVEEMKKRAINGSDLSGYISKNIGSEYERRDPADHIVITD